MMSMKQIVRTVSIRLAVFNKRLLLWHTQATNVSLKPHIQEQHIYNFTLKLASTACEAVLYGDKWDDNGWALY